MEISCFKAYDIRGRIANELNADICYRVGNATCAFLNAKTMVVGRDMRPTSDEYADAVIRGLTDAGIMVTASHNPADYDGLKLIREEARPISGDTGLTDIRVLAESDDRALADGGERTNVNILAEYIDHMMTYIDAEKPGR
jgi:phosphomannomutase